MMRVFAYYPGSISRQKPYTFGYVFIDAILAIAVNIEHKTERTGAFVSLVFGYSVVSLLYQNQASFGMNACVPFFQTTDPS